MRIAVGSFLQESHSFSPIPGSWNHFGPQELIRGQQMFEHFFGTRTEIGGAIAAAHKQGIELAPLMSARAVASAGPMQREVFETIRDELLTHLRQTEAADGVLLVLHGAMIADGYEDASGEILRAFRAELGPDIPLIATLDLHANVTRQMVAQATGLVGYHTAPHVDMFETGERGMGLLFKILCEHARPITAFRILPMILPGENGRTTDGPFAEVVNQVKELMKHPQILDASAFQVQPWLDVEKIGSSIVIIADGDKELAEQEAERLANEFWRRRHDFNVDLVSTAEAIQHALDSADHPIVFADPADAPSSGAPGDSTAILRELLNASPTKDCYLNIVDEKAVGKMMQAGIGGEVTLELGAKLAPMFYSPVEVCGYVKLLSDGAFVQKAPGLQGMTMYRGKTGVLKVGHIYIVVMERPIFQWDPELYRSVGLEPKDAQIVVVKSPAAFRAAYASFAAEILLLDAPGVCSSSLTDYPFKHVHRPLYPFDEIQDWHSVAKPDGEAR
jgi:microcystin degradation protein MlrC